MTNFSIASLSCFICLKYSKSNLEITVVIKFRFKNTKKYTKSWAWLIRQIIKWSKTWSKLEFTNLSLKSYEEYLTYWRCYILPKSWFEWQNQKLKFFERTINWRRSEILRHKSSVLFRTCFWPFLAISTPQMRSHVRDLRTGLILHAQSLAAESLNSIRFF